MGSMSSFDARLRLPGHSRLPVGVEVDVTSDRVTVSAGNRTVASWARGKLEVESQADGFHIVVDGEEVILNVVESARFADALGVPQLVNRAAATLGEHRSAGTPGPDPVDDYAGRIAEVAAALKSDSVSAAQAFGKWVRLLKEINHRHGQGSMPADQFFRLNTEVLDLIPEPKPAPDVEAT